MGVSGEQADRVPQQVRLTQMLVGEGRSMVRYLAFEREVWNATL